MNTHLLSLCSLILILTLSSCGGEATQSSSTGSSGGGGSSGVTPGAPMGKAYSFTIDYATDYLPPSGEYDMQFSTGAYDLNGDHYYVDDSNGTYTFTVNHSLMTISCNDSELGKATWVLTFTSSSSGTYKLSTPSDGDQYGTFKLFGTIHAPVGNG